MAKLIAKVFIIMTLVFEGIIILGMSTFRLNNSDMNSNIGYPMDAQGRGYFFIFGKVGKES